MKDMYGKKVNNGDWLVEGDNYGEVALFYKMVNDKPILMVRWGIGMIDKYDVDVIKNLDVKMKEAVKEGRAPEFMGKYYENMLERLPETKTEDLMLVEGVNVEIMNKFVDEGHEAIEYCTPDPLNSHNIIESQKPVAYFPDKEVVGEL